MDLEGVSHDQTHVWLLQSVLFCFVGLAFTLPYMHVVVPVLDIFMKRSASRVDSGSFWVAISCKISGWVLQAGLGPAAAAIFLQPGQFGENLEISTLQNTIDDVTEAPEIFTAQYLSEVKSTPMHGPL